MDTTAVSATSTELKKQRIERTAPLDGQDLSIFTADSLGAAESSCTPNADLSLLWGSVSSLKTTTDENSQRVFPIAFHGFFFILFFETEPPLLLGFTL